MVVETGRDRASALDDLVAVAGRISAAVESVIDGKSNAVRLTLAVLLAEGHLLIEDVPGVGKTMLAKALARSIDCTVRRIQFTPDLLPSDVTGVSAFNQERREFEFKPGPVFANIVVGDEINRASPKTQSALLESMEEGQVTVDGTTFPLESPFMVIATQNPVEMEGTYPLPEAQRDRFTARISIGYPTAAAELEMIDTHGSASPLDDVQAGGARQRRARPGRCGPRRDGLRPAQAVRDHAGQRHPVARGPAPRGVPAGDAPPAARQPCLGRARRPRLRDTGRRAGPGRPGARAPIAAHPGGSSSRASCPSRCWPASSRGCRCRRGADRRATATGRGCEGPPCGH